MHRNRDVVHCRRMRINSAFALPLLLLTTANAASGEACKSACRSWPVTFFNGSTAGEGRLHVLLLPGRSIHVRSTGRMTKDGTLILQQTIRQDSEAPTTREWRLKETGGGRYVGTLTDASGPVTGEVSGKRLHLRYTMKGAWRVQIEQWMDLEPGGATVQNRLKASKFGLPVASLRETIHKGKPKRG